MLHPARTRPEQQHASHPLLSPGGRDRSGPPGRIGAALLLGLCIAALALPGPLRAQEADAPEQEPQQQMYRVETVGGDILVGTLVSETEADVVIDTRQLGTVTVERADIERINELDPDRFRNGEYWFRNPQSTRYLFAPNAIGIPEGQGYYQNTWILFNNVNYGVSNNVSIGAGTVPTFLFGADAVPFWVLPKVSVSTPQDNLHLAGGAVLGGVLGGAVGDGGLGLGLAYGSATVGTRDHNATLGLGFGYADEGFSETPLINVSGMTRLSQTVYLISENYFVPALENGSLVSAGVRWAPRNFAVDFALARPLSGDIGGFIGVPWLGVTIPFGR